MIAQLYAPMGTPGGRHDGLTISVGYDVPPAEIYSVGLKWIHDGFLSDGITPRYSVPGHGFKEPRKQLKPQPA